MQGSIFPSVSGAVSALFYLVAVLQAVVLLFVAAVFTLSVCFPARANSERSTPRRDARALKAARGPHGNLEEGRHDHSGAGASSGSDAANTNHITEDIVRPMQPHQKPFQSLALSPPVKVTAAFGLPVTTGEQELLSQEESSRPHSSVTRESARVAEGNTMESAHLFARAVGTTLQFSPPSASLPSVESRPEVERAAVYSNTGTKSSPSHPSLTASLCALPGSSRETRSELLSVGKRALHHPHLPTPPDTTSSTSVEAHTNSWHSGALKTNRCNKKKDKRSAKESDDVTAPAPMGANGIADPPHTTHSQFSLSDSLLSPREPNAPPPVEQEQHGSHRSSRAVEENDKSDSLLNSVEHAPAQWASSSHALKAQTQAQESSAEAGTAPPYPRLRSPMPWRPEDAGLQQITDESTEEECEDAIGKSPTAVLSASFYRFSTTLLPDDLASLSLPAACSEEERLTLYNRTRRGSGRHAL